MFSVGYVVGVFIVFSVAERAELRSARPAALHPCCSTISGVLRGQEHRFQMLHVRFLNVLGVLVQRFQMF